MSRFAAAVYVALALLAGAAAAQPLESTAAPGAEPTRPRDRISMLAGVSALVWKGEGFADRRAVGEDGADPLITMQVAYERRFTDHLALTAGLAFEFVPDSGAAFAVPGLAALGSARFSPLPRYLYLEAGLALGWPREIAVEVAVGVTIPASEGMDIVIENQLSLAVLPSTEPFAIWFPTVGFQLAL